ncbi:MAG: bifunctional UDP-sugar hydrolase/5'-nucleotidase [Acidobacteriota bacterium]
MRALSPLFSGSLLVAAFLSGSCAPVAERDEASASPATSDLRELVLLFTNDVESAIDPVPAFWLEGMPLMGGAPHLQTMIDGIREEERAKDNPVFLFDSGDMFTGLLSRLTLGDVMMEMMVTLDYDAMAIGNHEFDYGSTNFLQKMHRVPFPVLSANTFWKGTDILYARPHAIVEKDGFRIGVIGVIGQDAMSVVLPSLVADLDFRDPIPHVRASVEELEPITDLIVVLAHQGKTGPMQSDQENDPEVWRDFEEDIALSTQVEGIDVLLGGHAHRGIDPPYVNPETGTIISQTFGHGTRVGVLRLWVDLRQGSVERHDGKLVTPWSAEYPADPLMEGKMAAFKAAFADQIEPVVGRLEGRLTRKYRRESTLGSFVADVLRESMSADVGITNAGGLRADLAGGDVSLGAIRDALPFLNSVVKVEMTGAQLVEVLEQGFSLERGMIQVSGLAAQIDLEREIGQRIVDLKVGGKPIDPSRTYSVSTNSFLAEGGDLYETFVGLEWVEHDERTLAEVVIAAFESAEGAFPVPEPGRIVRVCEVELDEG